MNSDTKGHEIIAYKQPSFIKSVNYKKLVDDIFKNVYISDNVEVENTIKKFLANLNYGLLEKSKQKKQQSYLYDTISVAILAQGGGRSGVTNPRRPSWVRPAAPWLRPGVLYPSPSPARPGGPHHAH